MHFYFTFTRHLQHLQLGVHFESRQISVMGLFGKYSQLAKAVDHLHRGAPSQMLDKILNATLPITHSPCLTPAHTNAASLIPSVTPGTQGPTHLLRRQSKHESCMMKCSPLDLAKTISPILNSPRLLFPSNNIRKKMKFHATTHHSKLK